MSKKLKIIIQHGDKEKVLQVHDGMLKDRVWVEKCVSNFRKELSEIAKESEASKDSTTNKNN